MNEVGVYGKVHLQATDLKTGEVSNIDVCNYITNYGLGRLFGPLEPGQFPANRIYFGTGPNPQNFADDSVPAQWRYVEITSVVNNNPDKANGAERESGHTIFTRFGSDSVFGNGETTEVYPATHGCLAYVGSDGVPHALTSFRLATDAFPINVKFTRLTFEYDIAVAYPKMVVNDGVSNFKVIKNVDRPTIPLNALYTPNAYRPFGVLAENTENYVIPMEGSWDSLRGLWIQPYKLIIKYASAANGQRFWLGPTMVQFTFAAPGEYELTIEVSRIDPDMQAQPMVRVSKYDTNRLLIEGPPHQWVNIRTIEAEPKTIVNTYVGLDGRAVVDGFTTWFNRGKMFTFVSIAANGSTAEVNLMTPDDYADPLIAFYRSGPTTMRAIGNFGDKVQISVERAFEWSGSSATMTDIIGTCDQQSTDEPGYFYCDMELPLELLGHEGYTRMFYVNTDLAGNVYRDTETWNTESRTLWVPNMPYRWYKEGIVIDATETITDGPYDDQGRAISSGFNYEIMDFKVEIL